MLMPFRAKGARGWPGRLEIAYPPGQTWRLRRFRAASTPWLVFVVVRIIIDFDPEAWRALEDLGHATSSWPYSSLRFSIFTNALLLGTSVVMAESGRSRSSRAALTGDSSHSEIRLLP